MKIRTREEIKSAIHAWTKDKDNFLTIDVIEELKNMSSALLKMRPNRVAQYLRGVPHITFDKKTRRWHNTRRKTP